MAAQFPSNVGLILEMQKAVSGLMRTQALYTVAKLGIADLLAEGPRDVASLAAITGSHPVSLNRLLRFLVGEGIFADDDQGRFSLTPSGALLRRGVPGSVRHMAIFFGSPSIWAAWGKLSESVATGDTAFELAHGVANAEYLQTHPEDARIRDAYMSEIPGLASAAAQYDFAGANLIVDVGGGQGSVLAAVLRANPQARGVLCDLPDVVAGAGPVLVAAGVADRVEVRGGDFFKDVPSGGDVYILSHILHDWDDERCRVILDNVSRAMHADSRLLAVELVFPDDNSPSFVTLLDLQMLVVTGGLQRTLAEFNRLFRDLGLQLQQIMPPNLIEVVPDGSHQTAAPPRS